MNLERPIASVLLVDDDTFAVRLVELTLKNRLGWTVTAAGDGAGAINLASSQKADLILLDLSLPDMDGREVLQRLKTMEPTSGTPVIVLTGTTESEIHQDVLKNGALGVIVKPVTPDGLVERIREILSQ